MLTSHYAWTYIFFFWLDRLFNILNAYAYCLWKLTLLHFSGKHWTWVWNWIGRLWWFRGRWYTWGIQYSAKETNPWGGFSSGSSCTGGSWCCSMMMIQQSALVAKLRIHWFFHLRSHTATAYKKFQSCYSGMFWLNMMDVLGALDLLWMCNNLVGSPFV